MEKIYEHANDLHVKAVKVYAKASDEFAYADAELSVKIPVDDLHNAFIKGMVIVDEAGVEYKPVSCKVAENVATVTYVTTAGSVATVKSE